MARRLEFGFSTTCAATIGSWLFPQTAPVNRARRQFLACPAFTEDEDVRIRGRHFGDQTVDLLHCRAVAGHLVGEVAFIGQAAAIAFEPFDIAHLT